MLYPPSPYLHASEQMNIEKDLGDRNAFFLCRPFNELLNDLRNDTLLGMDSYMIKMAFCCMKYFGVAVFA